MQFLNLLVPLFLIPLVVRKIGPSNFGVISFAQTFANFFILFIVYSFEYTATKEIAIYKNDKRKIAEIFNEVLSAKIIIFTFSFVFFLIIAIFSLIIRDNFQIQLIAFSVNIGYVIYPLWFFQGIQKLPISLMFNLISRIIMAIAVLFFLKSESLIIIYPLTYSLAQIFLGIVSIIYIKKYLHINIRFSSIKFGLNRIKNGFNIFLSMTMVNLYQNINLFLIAFFSSSLIIGYYASAVKLVTVILGVAILPLSMVLFPKISIHFHSSRIEGIESLKYTFWIAFFLGIFISSILFLFPNILIHLLFGDSFKPASEFLKILAIIPLINCLSNIFSIQGLINLNYKKIYLIITTSSFLICVLGIFLFGRKYSANAAAYSWLAAELFTLLGSFTYLTLKKIQIIDITYLFKINQINKVL